MEYSTADISVDVNVQTNEVTICLGESSTIIPKNRVRSLHTLLTHVVELLKEKGELVDNYGIPVK